jgi:glycosyltransferase involved in cell wall biosynthesis
MQFMRRFGAMVPVLYVNSLGVQAGRSPHGDSLTRRAVRKARSMARYYRDTQEGFRALSPVYMPNIGGTLGRVADQALVAQIQCIARIENAARPLLWVACPTAARVLHRWTHSPVVYQLSDCYGALWDGACSHAAELERAIGRRADLIVCSSRRLWRRALSLYGHGEYVDHGVDYQAFSTAFRRANGIAAFTRIRRPIVGFFGNLDENTVDLNLLARVIAARPQYSFVLIGAMSRPFERLRALRNVIALGQLPYRQIPQYGAHFDVCLMPWRQNEWIEHCNPVKLKEYLALGKPVVSTPFPELAASGDFCSVARGAEEFAAAIDRALRTDSTELSIRRRQWAARHTWESKVEAVLKHLEERGIHVGT